MVSRSFLIGVLSLWYLEVISGFNTANAPVGFSGRIAALLRVQLHAAGSGVERPSRILDENKNEDDNRINVIFVDDDDDVVNDDLQAKSTSRGGNWFDKVKPQSRQRLIAEGQSRAVANKMKREPSQDKKRRMMMFVKDKQREKKLASRVERPLGFDERAPLTAFFPGMEVTGVVISLTNFGAYIDVGTECDGILHISQITRDFFVEHPRQVLSPGDEVTVKVRSASPELKKMQLTMLDSTESMERDEDPQDRISLSEIETDDELWGEMKRITNFGAYVEVGAEVDGFLHFMDHPLWEEGAKPSEFMKKGERVRVWVVDVDKDKKRVRLTGNRPQNLPGPRLELWKN